MPSRLPPGNLTFQGLCVAAFLLALQPQAAMAAFPAKVLLVENHGDVLVDWVRTKVRGAVVVNVDAHDDCNPISRVRAEKLRRLLAANDIAAIGRANSVSDSGLYGISTYIAAAYALGTAGEAVWVAPKIQGPGILEKGTGFRIRTCPLESLPQLRQPVLLTIDADIVPSFASYRGINEVEAVRRIATALRAAPWDVRHASVCFSVDGGFLPVTLRWVGNALHEALEGKDPSRPFSPWPLLCKVEDWRKSLLPQEVVRRVRPMVLQRPADPWLRIYLSYALFKANDVPGAFTQARKAAQLDPGCCRILLEIGSQLADQGRIDEAEKFLAAAPAVTSVSAELALAQAYDRAGRLAQALGHLIRIRGVLAHYDIELLIGYCYERLGDRTLARQHYLGSVSLLEADETVPAFPDMTLALTSAERFLRSAGDQRQAEVLRRDARNARFFDNDGDTPGAAGR
jgi:tetratricopeptide (TPR) repeat protein